MGDDQVRFTRISLRAANEHMFDSQPGPGYPTVAYGEEGSFNARVSASRTSADRLPLQGSPRVTEYALPAHLGASRPRCCRPAILVTPACENGAMRTDGEYLFAAYLRQGRLGFEYEREVNGRCPDFSIDHPSGTVVAEVFEPELRLPPGGGQFDSYKPLRGAFKDRKAKQIKAVKEAGIPYVAVIASTNADLPFPPQIMAGAMFGNLATEFAVSDEPINAQTGRTVFDGGARLQVDQFRGVSAAAILERFNPTKWRLEAAIDARLAVVPTWRPGMTASQVAEAQAAIVRIATDTENQFLASGAFDPDARLARLTVLHNPYALHPLDIRAFDQHNDVQWGRIEVDGREGYGQLLGDGNHAA